ncbi:MAG: bifunctional riboflavin kinase/FAD synthetase [Bacteroidetes bacterium]|nr:bifunctional riboflavin kinase/FAD synthetase [Bacteroidota bacterium]
MKIHHNTDGLSHINFAVATIGMFDGVHLGHQQILLQLHAKARENKGESIVITFDTHPRIVLHHDSYKLKFINSYQEKIALMEKAGVDHIIFLPFTVEFSKKSADEFIKEFLVDKLHIKVLILGYDNRFGNKEHNNFNQLTELSKIYDFEIERVDVKDFEGSSVSSSKIREALDKGNIRYANQLLGYPYEFSGKVVKGNQIGRTIGFPTANIDLENDFKLIPSMGVYAVKVKWNMQFYNGMLNIGIRPTLNINKLCIEVHIFDIDTELYGQYLSIYFVDKIREEQRFNGLDALIDQLKKDEVTVKAILNT